MLKYYFRTIKDASLKEITDIRAGVWVHVESPTEEERQLLIDKLKLDPDILEDAQDFYEVPRLERDSGIVYFFTRYPFNDQTEAIDTAPLLIVVGESFLLTVTQRPVPQFSAFLDGKVLAHTTQKTKLFIQIMQVLTASFEKQLVGLRRAVHRDQAKLTKIGNKEIARFVNYEHKLNDMVSAVLPTNAALQQMMGGHYMQVFDDDRDLMDDLRIDNVQVVDSARSLLKTLQNIRSASEAILTNNLNNRIKTLTVFTILLTIPMVVSSFFGMNVQIPFEQEPYAFFWVLLLVLSAMTVSLWYFRHNDWL